MKIITSSASKTVKFRQCYFKDMWLYLPIVSLLFRSVIGYSQTENNIVDLGQPRNGNNDVLNEQNEQSAIASKEWKEGWSFKKEGSKTQNDPNITRPHDLRENGDPASTINDANHRDSGVKLVSKRSEFATSWFNLPLTDKEFLQKNKKPKLWGGKRIRFYTQNGGIRRLMRLPPFNQWWGKRMNRVTDVDELMQTLDNTNKQDEDTMELRNNEATSLDNWQEKPDGYPYRAPEVPVLNEINDNESVTDEDIADNDWLTSTHEKRVGNGKLKKMVFGPWRGKMYSELQQQTPIFYSWGG